eukprot:CAMPEP_0171453262 /NCGR_PEP_ID=MMETSP0945-20130129/1044_1 /TAXON_ID=109269 /ORGANISM="Vaucheria litorea, Strain CCMP2940" /LENGTH=301 /DNA_ID=CAMNT_0011978101 /DNA_START=43 /DNA_END=944 /DNA_ORIENTATION=-
MKRKAPESDDELSESLPHVRIKLGTDSNSFADPPNDSSEVIDESNTRSIYLLLSEEELLDSKYSKDSTIYSDTAALSRLAEFGNQLKSSNQIRPSDFSHFLPPSLIPIARAKWRIIKKEKANLLELLKGEAPSLQPRLKLPLSENTLRRSFFIRKREGPTPVETEIAFPDSDGRPLVAKRLKKPLRIGEDMSAEEIKEVLLPVHSKLTRLNFGRTWGNPFTKVITPETCVELNVPQYFEFVKEPMNLSWMKDKLKNAEYTSIDEYTKDICLIRHNAQTFNRKGDAVFGFADDLYKVCYQEL